jgi:DNA-directed RNA polymerase II subunit RPB1
MPQSNPETTAPLPTAGYPPTVPGYSPTSPTYPPTVPGYSPTSPTYPPTRVGYLQPATTPTSPPPTSRPGSSTEDTTWLIPDDPEATHRL